MFAVSGGYQSQKMGLFPFNPPLRGDFDHGKIMRLGIGRLLDKSVGFPNTWFVKPIWLQPVQPINFEPKGHLC